MIKVLINNVNVSGFWKEIYVTRAVDEASSSFTLKVTSIDSDYEDLYTNFLPSLPVTISHGDDLLISGYIDTVRNEVDESQHTLTIEGRSKTKDIVDSDVLDSSQFRNQKLSVICNSLASPYKVRVIIPPEYDRVVHTFQARADGETVFAAIERLANETGLNIGDNPTGDLILTYAGSKPTSNKVNISWGNNTGVKSYSHTLSEVNKYSEIRVTGQAKTTDTFYGKKASQILEKAIDPDAKRQRVKYLRADTSLTRERAIDKAMGELQASHARSNEISLTLYGWVGTKELWREGYKLDITSNVTGSRLDGDWVIAKVEYSINNSSGTTTQLTLNPPFAFKKPVEGGKLKDIKQAAKVKKSTKIKTKPKSDNFWHDGDDL